MVYWSQGDWERSADCCLKSIRIAGPLEHKLILTRASITLGKCPVFAALVRRSCSLVPARRRAGQADRRPPGSVVGDLQHRPGPGETRRLRARASPATSAACATPGRSATAGPPASTSPASASVNERLGRADLAESLYRKAIDFGLHLGIPSYLSGMLVGLARLLLAQGRAAEACDFYDEALAKISSVAGERLAGEDTRFDARVLGVRLRHALGESDAWRKRPRSSVTCCATRLLRTGRPRCTTSCGGWRRTTPRGSARGGILSLGARRDGRRGVPEPVSGADRRDAARPAAAAGYLGADPGRTGEPWTWRTCWRNWRASFQLRMPALAAGFGNPVRALAGSERHGASFLWPDLPEAPMKRGLLYTS